MRFVSYKHKHIIVMNISVGISSLGLCSFHMLAKNDLGVRTLRNRDYAFSESLFEDVPETHVVNRKLYHGRARGG
jgi:hypothetical protein